MAVFNEIMVSFYLYIMVLLTDYQGENVFRDTEGHALLYLIIFTVIVNFSKVLYVEYQNLKKLQCS